jgi:hypothetical protein
MFSIFYGAGSPAKHAGDTTQMRVPRPSRFCLGGDFILVGERPGILYHAACWRADEKSTHPPKRSLGGAPGSKELFQLHSDGSIWRNTGPAKEKSALESLDGYILGLLGAKTDIPT